MDCIKNLAMLRERLVQENLDYFILNTNDDHLTESPDKHWGIVQWLCGFSGSSATVIVSADKLAFWTDGRYIVEAQKHIKLPEAQLYNIADNSHPTLAGWLLQDMREKNQAAYTVAYDSRTFGDSNARKMIAACTPVDQAVSVRFCSKTDLLDSIWPDRPPLRHEPVFELGLQYAGVSRQTKLGEVRRHLEEKGACCYLLSALDDIAWLTNLRGRDYPVHPLFRAYLLLTTEAAYLFMDSPVDDGLRKTLADDGIDILPEHQINEILGQLKAPDCLYYDPQQVTNYMAGILPPDLARLEGPDIVRWLKAQKNECEVSNLHKCNVDEGLALCRVIKALQEASPVFEFDETDVGEMIERERGHSNDYVMCGNLPIVGYMANAALPHYRPVKKNAAKLQPQGMLLFDVVGHYLTGSTDISRTIALGAVTGEMRRDYTIVLKALISLTCQRFPAYASGAALDAAARNVVWNYGEDYRHSTGHGIGYCLTVHEGPQLIGPTWNKNSDMFCDMALLPNLVMSNEPGIYRVGEYGIRLENNIVVRGDQNGFYRFDTLTLCPFDRQLILPEMLEAAELDWLNRYHATVYENLSPYMNAEEQAWLLRQTAAIMLA